MMILTIQPSWLKNAPTAPLTMVRGRNTANIVRVEAITDIDTSCVACTAASLGFTFLSICEVMFSNTTIASSTTIPMAMVNALIEMMLRVLPVANRYITEATNEIGIESTMINVALHLPRKMKTTSITMKKVVKMVSFNELMVLTMFSEPSMMMFTLTSEGRSFCIFLSSRMMPLETFTALASVCF